MVLLIALFQKLDSSTIHKVQSGKVLETLVDPVLVLSKKCPSLKRSLAKADASTQKIPSLQYLSTRCL